MADETHVELYPFSYFDSIRRRWMRGRYLATLEEIRKRYPQYRIEGKPEIRTGNHGQFMPPGGPK